MHIVSTSESGEEMYQMAEAVSLPAVDGNYYDVIQPVSGEPPRTRRQLELLVGDYRTNAQYALDLADKYQALLDELPVLDTPEIPAS